MSALLAVGLAALAAGLLVGGPVRRHRRLTEPSEAQSFRQASWLGWPEGEFARPGAGGTAPPWAAVAVPWRTRAIGGVLLTLASAAGAWAAGLPQAVAVVIGSALGLAGVVLLGRAEPARYRRRLAAVERHTALTLDLLAGCVQAGLPLRRAADCVAATVPGPVADDLGVVLSAVDLGLSDAQAWSLLRSHPTLGGAADDVIRTVDTGALLAGALLQHARQARERRSAVREIAAKSLGVRCVLPMMLCFIPAFLLLGVVPSVVSAFLAAVPDIVGR